MCWWFAGKPTWAKYAGTSCSGVAILACLAILCCPSTSRGEAFRILDQGAAASGQGTAFAAQADDPSAIFYNPAGMTQLRGLQFYAGTLLVGGHYDYTSPTGGFFRGNVDGSIAFPPPINFYLTANFQKTAWGALRNLTVGIGVNSPFGLIINYPREVPFSAIDTRATLPLLDIKPTAAYRVNEYVSIGAGLDIYTFAGFAGEGAAQLNAFIPPGTDLELRVKDTAVGYNVGLLVTPWRTSGKPRLNLAFVYRSETTLNLTGKFLANGGALADAAVDLKLPQMFTWGAALWPVRDDHREWKLEVDVDYADWSSFKNLDVRLSNGAVLPEPRNWKGVFIVHVGTEYRWLQPSLLPDWEVAARLGYIRSHTPVPEATFEPAVPDANYNSFSVGLGLLCTGRGRFLGLVTCSTPPARGFGIKAIGLDVAYNNHLYESRTIAGNIRPVVNGTWETVLHAGVLSVRLNF